MGSQNRSSSADGSPIVPFVVMRRFAFLSLMIGGVAIVGCSAPGRWKIFQMLPGAEPSYAGVDIAGIRQKFLTERDPEAFRWLLAHRIHNEMTHDEVANELGESGERRNDDREYKTNGGFYQTTDVGYQWGPDREGHSVVLFFRDGKLVHFNPNDFL